LSCVVFINKKRNFYKNYLELRTILLIEIWRRNCFEFNYFS